MKQAMRIVGVIVMMMVLFAGSAWAQGTLTPPGPPGPTMKTLDQIEPRTPISSLPYTITNSGSYYVVSNLHSTGHGIVIETSGVSVDLMGFSLTGDEGVNDYGIHVAGATTALVDKVVIRNGTVSGFYRGLNCQYMNNSRIEQMVVSGNSHHGLVLDGDNGGQCNGNTIADCTISGNGGSGVYLYGEISGQCNGNTIANCTISGNGGFGVYLDGRPGQCAGNRVHGNQISKNVSRGICLDNADGNRVEANNVWGTTGITSYGIRSVSTTGNFILKNTCIGQTDNFDLSVSDTYGQIVTNSGALVGTDPWANFSR